jgi:hypothetical protein
MTDADMGRRWVINKFDIFTQWCSLGGRMNATDVDRMEVWTINPLFQPSA